MIGSIIASFYLRYACSALIHFTTPAEKEDGPAEVHMKCYKIYHLISKAFPCIHSTKEVNPSNQNQPLSLPDFAGNDTEWASGVGSTLAEFHCCFWKRLFTLLSHLPGATRGCWAPAKALAEQCSAHWQPNCSSGPGPRPRAPLAGLLCGPFRQQCNTSHSDHSPSQETLMKALSPSRRYRPISGTSYLPAHKKLRLFYDLLETVVP